MSIGGRKNPTITELSFKDDVLLVKSSQELFGRPSKKKKVSAMASPNKKQDEFSRSSYVLPYCSLEKGVGKELGSTVDKLLPGQSFKSKFGSDLVDTYHVRRVLAKKMKELEILKWSELNASGKSPPLLVTALMMPNVQRAFRLILSGQRRDRLGAAMGNWRRFISTKKAFLELALTRKNHAVMALQRFWRGSSARKELLKRRHVRLQQQQRRSTLAVATIESKYQIYKHGKLTKNLAEERLRIRKYECAVVIQKMFRGLVGRSWRVDCLRILLLKDMRLWADGNIQKLLDRTGLQDIRTIHMLLKCVSLTSIPARPMRSLPSANTIRSCRKWVAKRRYKENVKAALIKEEYRNMLRERKEMASNDMQDEFRRHFREMLLQVEKRKLAAQAIVDAREEAAARIRKLRESTKNIVESVKLEEVLERSEREVMFRNEYQKRAFDEADKRIRQKKHETEWVLMDSEDAFARKRYLTQEVEVEKQEKLYLEMQRVRKARLQDVVFNAASIVKGGHVDRSVLVPRYVESPRSTSEESRDVGVRTDDFIQVAKMVQDGFNGDQACGRTKVCACNVDWKTSPHIMRACVMAMKTAFQNGRMASLRFAAVDGTLHIKRRRDGADKVGPAREETQGDSVESPLCSPIEFQITADKDCQAKYAILVKLREARSERETALRSIWLLQTKLESEHLKLLDVRKQLRIGKYSTRAERKEVLQEAVAVEQGVARIADHLAAASNRVYEEAHREIKFFCTIFHRGFIPPDNRKGPEEPQPPNPLMMKLDDAEEAAMKAVLHEKSIFFDDGACESSSDALFLHQSLKSLPNWPTHYINFLVDTGKLIVEAPKNEEKSEYTSHFLSRSALRKTSNYHGLKNEHYKRGSKLSNERSVKLSSVPVVPDTKKVKELLPRNIPGLCKFMVENIKESSVYGQAEIAKKWSASFSKWCSRMESAWKEDKYVLCLSYLQRARHILYGGGRYGTLKHNDTRLARVVKCESVYVLMEFLLCRGTLVLRPKKTFDYGVVEETRLPSEVVDAVLGKHPFSIVAYLDLLSEKHKYRRDYDVGAEKMQQQQANISAALLKNNIFALSNLLKLPLELQSDALMLRRCMSADVKWDTYAGPDSYVEYHVYQFLKLHHLYSMEVYASVLMAITMELEDCQKLVCTLLHGSLINIVEVTPNPPTKKKFRKDTATKARATANKTSAASNRKGSNRQSIRSTEVNPKVDSRLDTFSEKDVVISASTEKEVPLKPIIRIELAEVVNLGVVLKAYRTHTMQPKEFSPFWIRVPSWMLPAYYWGRRAKPNFMSRLSTVGSNDDPALEAFEVKMTDWASSVVRLLVQKVNRKFHREKKEMEQVMLDIHRRHMLYEDKLSEAVERITKNKLREETEAREWEFQNGVWYKRLYNWAIGKKKISFYPDGCSPEELEVMLKNVDITRTTLPSSMSPTQLDILFRRPICTSRVFCPDDPGKMSLKSRRNKHRQENQMAPSQPRISWFQSSFSEGDDRLGYAVNRRACIPKKFVQWLGEMFVGGGVRSVICIARAVMDYDNNPSGSSVVEPMALYTLAEDVETVKYVRSCRVGFQNRPLCEANFSAFAVSESDSGRLLSEYGFKMLRTELPHRELDSLDLLHQTIWKMFTKLRYNNDILHSILTRLQTLVRMCKAKKLVLKMREQRERSKSVL